VILLVLYALCAFDLFATGYLIGTWHR